MDETVTIGDLSVTITAAAIVVLEKIAASGLQHPTTGNPTFLGTALVLDFSDGDLRISESGRHKWPYDDEPSLEFDDRGLA